MDSGPNSRSSAVHRDVLEFRHLLIDITARRVICDDAEISLTKSEFDLLVALAREVGSVVSPEQLFRALWGSDWVGDGHAVEVQISRLRIKLGESSRTQRFIKTVRSAGYRFDGDSPGPIVTLSYDGQLRVTDIVPKDRPFFGWDPYAVIGTYFILAAGPVSELPQAEAIAFLHAVAASGPEIVAHAYEVRCADGTTQARHATVRIHVDESGKFDGAHIAVS